jgi:signal transduction histidine kinase
VFNGLPESAQVVEATIEPIPPVQAHPGLIRQVLVNLITNALKFTRGRPLARITIGSERRNGELACFVSDNGVGFGPGEADRLFGMFYQARGRERHEGTGIGLAIVKSIVEHHGGRVWAEGEEGVGATFYFTLGGAA